MNRVPIPVRAYAIITTDRWAYRLALTSTTRTAMSAISWSYPEDRLLAIARAPGGGHGQECVGKYQP